MFADDNTKIVLAKGVVDALTLALSRPESREREVGIAKVYQEIIVPSGTIPL